METVSVQYKGYTINYDGEDSFFIFHNGNLVDSFVTIAPAFPQSIFGVIVDYIDNEIDIY